VGNAKPPCKPYILLSSSYIQNSTPNTTIEGQYFFDICVFNLANKTFSASIHTSDRRLNSESWSPPSLASAFCTKGGSCRAQRGVQSLRGNSAAIRAPIREICRFQDAYVDYTQLNNVRYDRTVETEASILANGRIPVQNAPTKDEALSFPNS
jgi:hypothetical protein